MKNGRPEGRPRLSLSYRFFLRSGRFASEVPFFFQHLVHATLIDTVRGCDVVLVFASPMSKPNIHRIVVG
jgi:hypothetical protein